MIPCIDFKRKKPKRSFVVNVYILVSPKFYGDIKRTKYNKKRYRIHTITISKKADLNSLAVQGFDQNIDRLYILSDSLMDKYLKKKPSLLKNASTLYSYDELTNTLNNELL